MPEQSSTAQAPFWRPSEDGARLILMWLGIAVGVIGAIALALSFVSVMQAARPYFGGAAWAIPVLMDSTIGVLTFFSIVAELNRLRSPMARYTARFLVALTVYANVAPQHSLYGRVLHGAPPTVWVLIVAVAEGIIRRLMGLSDEKRIEALRRSLWLLRPVATWRIWRMMRIHQIATYADALDRDAARAAVVGRLRLHHGRFWRQKAPLGERIALRLQGRDPAGVAAVLSDHTATVALLAGTVAEPVPAPQPEPLETAPEPAAEDAAAAGPKQARRRAPIRSRKSPNAAALLRSEAELVALASALNAQVIAETGTPVSLRRLKADLHVGQLTAERLRAVLAAQSAPALGTPRQAVSEPVPDDAEDASPRPVEYANGTPVGTDAA